MEMMNDIPKLAAKRSAYCVEHAQFGFSLDSVCSCDLLLAASFLRAPSDISLGLFWNIDRQTTDGRVWEIERERVNCYREREKLLDKLQS
ncbi:hypothetical protein ACN38_g3805 [Penicillium nordicum]|uniref:Uncharacterized protein n=1 Tax=Penicillium nordicum TaxID=229535 RepID=A0A0M8P7S1_9EURO|nr:hypothetical protein ACN38_g3805 [Penicillium nordicum]